MVENEPRNSQMAEKIMMWGGIWGDRVIGPYFFNDNVTGKSFLEMLKEEIIPHFETFPDFDDVIFQLDGAPVHYAFEIQNYLTSKFTNKWFGRTSDKSDGLNDWPRSSRD